MRVLVHALFIIQLLAFFPAHSEEIADFQVDIHVADNGEIRVTENIDYDFQYARRHGIYRDIPVKYDYGYKRYSVRLKVNRVTDFNGDPYQYKVSRSGGRVNIRIGDPDSTITGRHGYRIEYTVDGAIVHFDEHDELYWNVTGNEWRVPINKAGARVYFDDAMGSNVQAECYTGALGSSTRDCTGEAGSGLASFAALNPLRAGQGLTIVIGMPKGFISELSAYSKLMWFLGDNWYYMLPLFTLLGLTYLWHTRGRDPEGRGVIAVKYEPPKNLTPAEAGTLVDESADILDITSTVIDLAVRGFLKIEEKETTAFYFFTNRDYRLVKTEKPEGSGLKPFEARVYSGIFKGEESVMLSDLRNKFYKELPGIKSALYSELTGKKYFPVSPEKVKSIYRWLGIGLLILGFFLISKPPLGISIILSGVISLIFSRFMPRKTLAGRHAYEELLGFREFIERAEKDRLERLAKDDPTLFDRVLPYALVFGLEDKWANAFSDIYREPPTWYYSPGYGSRFSPNIFVNDIGRSLGVMSSTLSSAPRKSGGSGLGGGGSSGGGFGGGGGGSW